MLQSFVCFQDLDNRIHEPKSTKPVRDRLLETALNCLAATKEGCKFGACLPECKVDILGLSSVSFIQILHWASTLLYTFLWFMFFLFRQQALDNSYC